MLKSTNIHFREVTFTKNFSLCPLNTCPSYLGRAAHSAQVTQETDRQDNLVVVKQKK